MASVLLLLHSHSKKSRLPSVNQRGVEKGNRSVFLAHQQSDFSAAQNNSLRSLLRQFPNDPQILFPGLGRNDPQTKLMINYIIDQIAVLFPRNQNLNALLPRTSL